MPRLSFAVAALSSLVFLLAFVALKFSSPGLSIGAALIAMPLFLTAFGFSKTTNNALSADAKGAGWAAIAIALVGLMYLAVFFSVWAIAAALWLGLHVPLAVVLISTPTSKS
jgi:hypothetical protein